MPISHKKVLFQFIRLYFERKVPPNFATLKKFARVYLSMKTSPAKSFYLKNSIWIFFCLGLAAICNLANTIVINIGTAENESSTAGAIMTIRRLQYEYAAAHRGRFAPNFDELIKAKNLDKKFGGQNPVVNGYVLTMQVSEPTGQKPAFYSVTADPLDNEKGTRHFYYDSTLGVTKVTQENRPANAADPSI
jgi:hypothetical protein